MSMSQQNSPSWGALLFALAGAAYCAVLASPMQESLPCPSSGCFLFKDVSVAGISLWWFGTAAFILLALLCIARYRSAAYVFSALCLAGDCGLLTLMFFTAPCLTCLGAALLFALVFLCLRRPVPGRYQTSVQPPRPSYLFLLWGALFIANLGSAANEQLGDWVISGPPDSEYRVYFSPSCPACREAIAVFAGRAAFLPVAEREEDYQAIAAMQAALDDGKTITEALAAAFDKPAPFSPVSYLAMRVKLLRNSGTVLGRGFDKLPLLMINGMPQADTSAPSPASAPVSTPVGGGGVDSGFGLPPELNPLNLGQCGDDIAPCDTTPPGP